MFNRDRARALGRCAWAAVRPLAARGAGLLAALLLVLLWHGVGSSARLAYVLENRAIDFMQRLSPFGPDVMRPADVVVVAIDLDAVHDFGQWPWARHRLAELITHIAAAEPKGLAVDLLFSRQDVFTEIEVLKRLGPAGVGLLDHLPKPSGDEALGQAIRLAPTVLATPVYDARDLGHAQSATMLCERIRAGWTLPRPAQCIAYPVPPIFEAADGWFGVARGLKDRDGVLRRAALAYLRAGDAEAGSDAKDIFLPGLAAALLTACSDDGEGPCMTLDVRQRASSDGLGRWLQAPIAFDLQYPRSGFALHAGLDRDGGALIDFRAAARIPEISAARLLSERSRAVVDEAQAALRGKYVFLGVTAIGAQDRHTTPHDDDIGLAGVTAHAVAAQALLDDALLLRPAWGDALAVLYALAMGLLALRRPGGAAPGRLAAAYGGLAALPLATSFVALQFGVVFWFLLPTAAAIAAGVAGYARAAWTERARLRALERLDDRNRERLEAARELQLGALPADVALADLGLVAAMSSEPGEINGGDFYDLIRYADGRVFAAVGDVSGHNLEASQVALLAKALASAIAASAAGAAGAVSAAGAASPTGAATDLAGLLARINREFLRQAPKAWLDRGGFLTFTATLLDTATGRAEFAAAGAAAATVVSRAGGFRAVAPAPAPPLGWADEAQAFDTGVVDLQPGDVIVMFSDGVVEAEAPGGALLGDDAVLAAIAGAAAGGASAVHAALRGAVATHQAGGEATDDVTILALGRVSDGPNAAA